MNDSLKECRNTLQNIWDSGLCELWVDRKVREVIETIGNLIDTPRHETVSGWENRTGEAYPDDAPVWFRETGSLNGDSFNYWELGTYKTNTPYGKDETVIAWIKWNKDKSIVANHYGKPEDN